MTFILIALAAFFLVTTLQTVVSLHDVWWASILWIISLLGLWLCGDLTHWYGAFAIAGIGLLILRVENLLIVKADESLSMLSRYRR